MNLRVITPPVAYPVTLSEAKEWCRVDDDDTSQDGTLNMIIAAAVRFAENRLTGRAFVERVLEVSYDNDDYCAACCCGYIELPYPPLLYVESINYTDVDSVERVWSAGNYEADTASEPGRIRPVLGASWPSVKSVFNAWRVRYRAGYRPTGSPTDLTDNSYLPADMRVWMNSRICTTYENRAQLGDMRQIELPRSVVDAWLDDLVVGTRFF